MAVEGAKRYMHCLISEFGAAELYEWRKKLGAWQIPGYFLPYNLGNKR